MLFDPNDLGAEPAPGPAMGDPSFTWTVGQVGEWLQAVIAAGFPEEIWIEGEIHNLNRSARGHVYFTLVEAGADRRTAEVALGVTLFEWYRQGVNQRLKRAGGAVRMEDGVRIRIRAQVELYGRRGEIKLRMTSIDPEFTLGALAIERARLLRTLSEEGLLRANAARPVSPFPLRIGLVTSMGSAAHADVMSELERTAVSFDVCAVDARVQGVDAVESLGAALATLDRLGLDLILVVRGGGARTDLAAFDHESVVRAIASCVTPVWSGVGHETDSTVTDEVAHTAFKTPTAAAAAVVERVAVGWAAIEDAWDGVASAAAAAVAQAASQVDRHAGAVATSVRRDLDRAAARLSGATTALRDRPERRLAAADTSIGSAAATVVRAGPRVLDRADRHLAGVAATVRAHDPARTVARGWSITRRADGTVVRSVDDVTPGSPLITALADGEVTATVTEIHPHPVPSAVAAVPAEPTSGAEP